jgi:hypothetical protein
MEIVKEKQAYLAPNSKSIIVEYQGIICESPTEPINPGTGHDW